jgi:hypothetical protein
VRITMKTLYASPEGALQPGQTADVNPKLGNALVKGGYAVAGDEEFSPADADAANQKAGARRGSGGRPSTKRGRGAAADDGGSGDGGTGDGDGGTEGTGDDANGDQGTGDGDQGTETGGDGAGSQD